MSILNRITIRDIGVGSPSQVDASYWGNAYPYMVLNSATYPMSLPYRTPVSQRDIDALKRPFGRIPRALDLILDTLICLPSENWREKSGTLIFGRDFYKLAHECGVGSNPNAWARLKESVLALQYREINVDGRQIPILAKHTILDSRGLNNRSVTFTPEYIDLVHNAPQWKIDTDTVAKLMHHPICMDMYFLAVMTCPDGKRAYIPRTALYRILPVNQKSGGTRPATQERVELLNETQNAMRFTYENDIVGFASTDTPDHAQSVTLTFD